MCRGDGRVIQGTWLLVRHFSLLFPLPWNPNPSNWNCFRARARSAAVLDQKQLARQTHTVLGGPPRQASPAVFIQIAELSVDSLAK